MFSLGLWVWKSARSKHLPIDDAALLLGQSSVFALPSGAFAPSRTTLELIGCSVVLCAVYITNHLLVFRAVLGCVADPTQSFLWRCLLTSIFSVLLLSVLLIWSLSIWRSVKASAELTLGLLHRAAKAAFGFSLAKTEISSRLELIVRSLIVTCSVIYYSFFLSFVFSSLLILCSAGFLAFYWRIACIPPILSVCLSVVSYDFFFKDKQTRLFEHVNVAMTHQNALLLHLSKSASEIRANGFSVLALRKIFVARKEIVKARRQSELANIFCKLVSDVTLTVGLWLGMFLIMILQGTAWVPVFSPQAVAVGVVAASIITQFWPSVLSAGQSLSLFKADLATLEELMSFPVPVVDGAVDNPQFSFALKTESALWVLRKESKSLTCCGCDQSVAATEALYVNDLPCHSECISLARSRSRLCCACGGFLADDYLSVNGRVIHSACLQTANRTDQICSACDNRCVVMLCSGCRKKFCRACIYFLEEHFFCQPCARNFGYLLGPLTCEIMHGSKVLILGPEGCGKSMLLLGIAGLLPVCSGRVTCGGSLAIVSFNVFFIAGASVRENILFGREMDHRKYARVVDACCLSYDFSTFDDGDSLVVEAGGKNVSGGQARRIGLARAIYSDASVVLLDDVLTGLDPVTRLHVFRTALMGELKDRTVIYCSRYFLPGFSTVIEIYNGSLRVCEHAAGEEDADSVAKVSTDSLPLMNCDTVVDEGKRAKETKRNASIIVFLRRTWKTTVPILALLFFTNTFFYVLAFVWGSWLSPSAYGLSPLTWSLIYLGCVSFWYILQGACDLAVLSTRFALGDSYFSTLTEAIFDSSSLSSSASSSLGQDITNLDQSLAPSFFSFFNLMFGVVSLLVSGAIVAPVVLCVAPVLAVSLFLVGRFFAPLCCDLEAARLDFCDRTVNICNSLIEGQATIALSGREQIFIQVVEEALRKTVGVTLLGNSSKIFLLFTLEGAGMLIVIGLAFFFITLGGSAFAVYVLVFALDIPEKMQFLSYFLSTMSASSVPLTRLEAVANQTSWSNSGLHYVSEIEINGGEVEIENLFYSAEGGKLLLHHVNLHVPSGTLLALVGRTGAGKSTLIRAFSRPRNWLSGSIRINGLNLREVAESRLMELSHVVDQDPFCLNGTVRENVDPLGRKSDHDLVHVMHELECTLQLDDTLEVERMSHAEKLVIAIVRALCCSAPVILLDEPILNHRTLSLLRDSSKTCICVLHDLEFCRYFDVVARLENGTVLMGLPNAQVH